MIVIGFGSLILILLLLVAIARGTRRTARYSRRVPCVSCGEALLPAARHCPNCHARQPSPGWAGRREKMWQPPPPQNTFRHPAAAGQRIPFLSPIIGVGFGIALGIALVGGGLYMLGKMLGP
jgi:hypothetical protein